MGRVSLSKLYFYFNSCALNSNLLRHALNHRKFGEVFSDELYIDFSDDSYIEQCVFDVYKRIHCPGSNVVIRSFAEGIYEGKLNQNGQRHGFGTMKHKENLNNKRGVYQGMFVNGRKEGLGKYINRRNDIYIGTFKDNKKRGHGRLTREYGSSYAGSYLDDKFNGLGTYTSSNGDLYTGTFENDAFNGYGKMQYADGSEYNGSLRNGNFHGAGSYKSCNGDTYIGEMFNHQFHGEGMLKYSNGFEYNGFFQKGHFRGKGAYKTKDGDSYEGQFEDHMFHGEGKMMYTNGDVFDGRWKHGKPIDGTRAYANGDTYRGQWKNHLRHGKGYFMFPSGDTYEGQYRRGERNGKGTYTFVNGGKYEGAWLDGVRHGYGVREYADGAMFKGIYSEGARKEGRIDFANKVVYEGSILESTTKEATSDGSEVQEKKIGVLKKGTLDFERTVTTKKKRHRVANFLRRPTFYGVEWSYKAAKPNFKALRGLKIRMGQHQPNTQNLLQMLSICSNPLPSTNMSFISQESKCEKIPVIASLRIPTSSFKKGVSRLQAPHESQDEKVSPRGVANFNFVFDSGKEFLPNESPDEIIKTRKVALAVRSNS